MSYSAIFTGFNSLKEVERFIDWYEGQGEQCEGLVGYMEDVGVEYCNVDLRTPYVTTEDSIICKISPSYLVQTEGNQYES
jgi:hypothetical protein